MPPLLNYTTRVPVARTVSEVQALLVRSGARAIMAEYDGEGRVSGMSFAVDTPRGREGYTLPVNADRVLAVLQRAKVDRRFQTPEHAENVAWRILKDWLEAQLAILQTEMVSLDQVMLPYMRAADGRTVYELFVEDRLSLPSMTQNGGSATCGTSSQRLGSGVRSGTGFTTPWATSALLARTCTAPRVSRPSARRRGSEVPRHER